MMQIIFIIIIITTVNVIIGIRNEYDEVEKK